MIQCNKCLTWVNENDLYTGGCVNCMNKAFTTDGSAVTPEKPDADGIWDNILKYPACVIRLHCRSRHAASGTTVEFLKDTTVIKEDIMTVRPENCQGCRFAAPEGSRGPCLLAGTGPYPVHWHIPEKYVEVCLDLPGMTKDGIGGLHTNGIGINPQGHLCGECFRTTCEGCDNADLHED